MAFNKKSRSDYQMKVNFGKIEKNVLLESNQTPEKIVKDYATGGWRKLLSGLTNLGIAAAYGVAAAGTVSSFGTPAWIWAGLAVIFFAVSGTFGLLIKSLLLGADNIVRRNPRMRNLFDLAKKDSESMDLIESLKKELDAKKPNKEKVKDLKRKLIHRFKALEKKQVSFNESLFIEISNVNENLFDGKEVTEKEANDEMKRKEEVKKQEKKEKANEARKIRIGNSKPVKGQTTIDEFL